MKEELKELQMEKLRELLNEFEPYIQKDWEHRDNLWYGVICWESAIFTKEIWIQKIISKEYKFIKWLVEKNKIDTGWKITEDLTYEHFQIPRKYFRWGKYARLSEEMNDIFYHRILACLSIQDNPIEFLISILK